MIREGIVLPLLWGGDYAMPIIEARSALLRFLATYDEELEIVTDAPAYDWELFCELAYDDGKWPQNVRSFNKYPIRVFRLGRVEHAGADADPNALAHRLLSTQFFRRT